jgi:hypothetical protein
MFDMPSRVLSTIFGICLTAMKRYDFPSSLQDTSAYHSLKLLKQLQSWWKDHGPRVLASTRKVLEIVEKGLDGLPVYGAKAALGATISVLQALQVYLVLELIFLIYNQVQTKAENAEEVVEIMEKLESVTRDLSQYTLAPIHDSPSASVSPDVAKRVAGFIGYVRITECRATQLSQGSQTAR